MVDLNYEDIAKAAGIGFDYGKWMAPVDGGLTAGTAAALGAGFETCKQIFFGKKKRWFNWARKTKYSSS